MTGRPVSPDPAAALLGGPAAAPAPLADRFRAAVREAAGSARTVGRPVPAWASARISAVDLLDVLERAAGDDPALWCRPEEGVGLAGVGTAWALDASGPGRFGTMRDRWETLLRHAAGRRESVVDGECPAGPVALGGFAFGAEDPRGREWAGYGAASMRLPRVAVAQRHSAAAVTVAAVIRPEDAGRADAEAEASLSLLSRLFGAPPARGEEGARRETHIVEDPPSAAEWKEKVAGAARAVRDGGLRKVVLARRVRVRSAGLDPIRALRRLRENYPTCTLFAVDRGGRWFFGATPEQLVRVGNGEVHTMALAGSAPRGSADADDARLGAMLLASPKDRLEHAVVVEAMRDVLAEACGEVAAGDGPALLKVSNVQHLHTPLSAKLRDHLTVLDLVERLHPTPAVGGVPRDAALAWIGAHEDLERGWYAGPVGWMDAGGQGEFAVAIRSALACEGEAWLYAGCGIMADSEPDAEWAESCLKLQPVLSALEGAAPL